MCSPEEFAAIYDLAASIQKMSKAFIAADQQRRA